MDEVSIVSETSLLIDWPRLIEHAFPLKQASLDSVHEKNVRHGHISTLHIWPARRPLAACRAALIATLLPDPGTPEERRKLCEKIGGKVVEKIEKKKMPNGRTVERIKEETEGGILHWGARTENESRDLGRMVPPGNPQGLRRPRAARARPVRRRRRHPLEAMRLGCEATAIDINPVAWFILKCTLEYPQKLAGQTRPLPDFILRTRSSWRSSSRPIRTRRQSQARRSSARSRGARQKQAGFRASGGGPRLARAGLGLVGAEPARRELAQFYPIYADFEPLKPGKAYEKQPMRLVPLKDDGTPDIDSLNAEFNEDYLADQRNPRWVASRPSPTCGRGR